MLAAKVDNNPADAPLLAPGLLVANWRYVSRRSKNVGMLGFAEVLLMSIAGFVAAAAFDGEISDGAPGPIPEVAGAGCWLDQQSTCTVGGGGRPETKRTRIHNLLMHSQTVCPKIKR